MKTTQQLFQEAKSASNSQESIRLFEELVTHSRNGNDSKFTADCLVEIAIMLQDTEKYSEALKCFNEAQQIYESLSEIEDIKKISLLEGKLYSKISEYDKAIECFIQNLFLNKEDGSTENIAFIHNLIGFEYDKLGIFSQSLLHYKDALSLYLKLNDKNEIVKSCAYIGNVYNYENKFESAIEFLYKSLSIAEEIGDPELIIMPLAVFISVYNKSEQREKALLYSSRAILMLDKINYPKMKINVLKSHGALCIELGDTKNGINYVLEACELAENVGNKALLVLIYKILSHGYEKAGNFEMALKYLKLYDKLKEETTGKEIGFKTKQLKIQFELEDAKREKELIEKEAKLNESNARLQHSELEMKALRSQMNPHFIFNALQSIQKFLVNHKSDEANVYLLKFSKLMRAVLENSQHNEVSLKSDLQALEWYMQLESLRLIHPFTYEFKIASSINVEETNIPPLILQPFVENAIWHGFQYKNSPGHIIIDIRKLDNELVATVEDDGLGRDRSKKVEPPTLVKKGSLGIKLTEERLKILNQVKNTNARFVITDKFSDNNVPIGTKVELSFPFEHGY